MFALVIACGDDEGDTPGTTGTDSGTATATDTGTDTDTDSGSGMDGGSDSDAGTDGGSDTGGSDDVLLSEVGTYIPIKMGNWWKYQNLVITASFNETLTEFEVLVDEELIHDGKQYLKFFDMWVRTEGKEYFELFEINGTYYERKFFEEDLENGDSWESDEVTLANGDKLVMKYIQKSPCIDPTFNGVAYECVNRFDAEMWVNGSYQGPPRYWFIKPGIGVIRESMPTASSSDSDLLEYDLQ